MSLLSYKGFWVEVIYILYDNRVTLTIVHARGKKQSGDCK